MRYLLPLLAILGCTPEEDREITCGDPEDVMHVIVTSMGYMRSEDGVSQGYDIDGTDDPICGIQDFTDTDGNPGIDNGLSLIIPALEASEAKVVEGYINSGILEGRLLFVLEISRLDDIANDECVDVEFFQATGEPLLGTDGGILPGQTLARNPDTPTASMEGATLVDGRLDVFPMDIDLPVSVLDAVFELNLLWGGVRLEMGEDGLHSGFFTGAIDRTEVYEILNASPGVGEDVVEMVEGMLGIALDIQDEQGSCELMSSGLVFEAAEIFLFD